MLNGMYILIIAWLMIGFICTMWLSYIDLKRGTDFTNKDLIACIGFSLFGPIMIILAVIYAIKNMEEKTLIKAKDYE